MATVNGQQDSIPVTGTRRVVIQDASQLPSDYSRTPGGTIFSTTPNGTRIVYNRSELMHIRNSPLSKTPPANLPKIPGVTCQEEEKENSSVPAAPQQPQQASPRPSPRGADGMQFELDI